jgi:hypothetical protein
MTPQRHLLVETVTEALAAMKAQDSGRDAVVSEAFTKIAAILKAEDKGWTPLFGPGDEDERFGLRLEDLKEWSRKIRESMVGAPWLKRGYGLRSSYIWQNGIRYANIPEPTRGKANIQKIIDRPGNQTHFFSKEARKRREGRLYSDGIALWLGDERTKDLEALPLGQITGQLLDPDGLGMIWAYRRQWEERNLTTGKKEPKVEWYFTDQFKDKRPKGGKIRHGEQDEPVSATHVIFDQHANRQDGLAYGAPDALAAWVWNQYVRDGYMDGRTMQQALATIAYKVTNGSAKGAQNASLQFANPQGAGSTAVLGQNDLTPMTTAGRGYDFSSMRELLATVATALDVSVIHLSANPADSGSSYGSALTLDLPTRLAMESRRDEHVELDKRVLRWMGLEEPEVAFKPYDSGEEQYRAAQAIILQGQAGVYSPQEVRNLLDDLYGRPNGKVPTGTLPWNNAKSTPAPPGGGAPAEPPQVASPAQGRSNGTGGQQGGSASNDLRSDVQSK